MTTAMSAVTHTSVDSRESVKITLTLAALNDLEVKCGNSLSADITAPAKEKVWTILGFEHGMDAGKRAVIVCALY